MRLMLRNRLHRSVFFHILTAVTVTGLMVILTIGMFFKLHIKSQEYKPLKSNLMAYAHYIINDIGHPPDQKRAKILSSQLRLNIRYNGHYGQWATSSMMITDKQIEETAGNRNFHHGPHHKPFIRIDTDDGYFVFQPNFKPPQEIRGGVFVFLLLLIIGIFIVAWIWIKWILKPIILLDHGVQALSAGNLDHEIPVKRQDELGKLTISFNLMTKKLKEMMANKDQLLLDISHELRSPITRLKVALELLPKSKNRTALMNDVDEMERLVNRILEAGRHDTVFWEPLKKTLSLKQLLLQSFARRHTKPHPFSLTHDDPAMKVSVDKEQMEIVFKNILENAVKYSTDRNQPITISTGQKNNRAVITITDKGVGIPEDKLPFVFEPFYRVDPSRSRETGGFGLGLSICKKIMEAHGGSITVISHPGQGTQVDLFLPVAPY